MDVEALMGLATKAVEQAFGRPVTYTPVGGSAVSTLSDGSPLMGVWSPPSSNLSPASAAYENPEPRLDFSAASLTAAGITPAKQDVVEFDVLGETRSYRVTDVRPNDEGSVILILASRA